MKKNICFVCLNKNLANQYGQELANILDMFFADVNGIMQYNLIDDNMLGYAGKEYFDLQQKKTLKQLANYENVLLTCSLDILNYHEQWKLISEKCVMVYLKYSKEDLENDIKKANNKFANNLLTFDVENVLCEKMCDIKINMGKYQKTNIKRIRQGLMDYYMV